MFCASFEAKLDQYEHREHLIFEALGLAVLCLLYFSTCVDLLRKLRVFVLEDIKREARLVRTQFLIFFVAYGSKVITLCYWIKNPPHERNYVESFLINTDVMAFIWFIIPISFVLWMQTRSFIKMREEKRELDRAESRTDVAACSDGTYERD